MLSFGKQKMTVFIYFMHALELLGISGKIRCHHYFKWAPDFCLRLIIGGDCLASPVDPSRKQTNSIIAAYLAEQVAVPGNSDAYFGKSLTRKPFRYSLVRSPPARDGRQGCMSLSPPLFSSMRQLLQHRVKILK